MPKIKVRPVDQIIRKPVSYAFAAFMRHCQLKNLAPYSYRYYNKNNQYFLDTENEIKYVDEICPEVIERFIGKLMDRGNKVTAIPTTPKPVRWFVLKRVGNEAYVLSVRSFGSRQFSASSDCNWKTSDIRKWINEELFNTLFSEEEKKAIISVMWEKYPCEHIETNSLKWCD